MSFGIKRGAARVRAAVASLTKLQGELEVGIGEMQQEQASIEQQISSLVAQQGDVINARLSAERTLHNVNRLIG